MAQRQRRDDDLDIPPLANAVFAGEEAAQNLARQGITGPANAIALARSLRAQGVKNPKEIHARTSELLRGTPYAGVHFTADGTPRFEITDHSAKMRKGALGSSGKAYLGDVLDHPELYRAVPGSSLPSVSVSGGNDSSYTPGAQEIEIGKKHTARLGKTTVLKDTAKGPLLHETQHVVQELHGLSPGSSPDDFRKLYPGTDEVAREKRRTAYTLTAGEQEAEATRIRQNLTAEERRWRPATEDMEPVKAHRRVPVETGRQMQFGGDLPKGYSVTRKSDADLARYNATEYTIRHNGNEVGTAFVTDLGDKVKVSKIDIAASHTRKGIGTALYGQIERDFGKALVPDDHLSPKAYAFWQKHRPDALGDHRVLKSGNAVRDPHGYLASEYAPAKQMFLDDLADRAIDAWNRATTREVVEGRPIHQRRLDPRRVAADPGTFQFKSGGDKAGVTDRLKGVKEWDPLAAGKQIVYQRANGEYVIADGHQRRGLALRALEAGQKDVALDAYVLREKDGWSPRDVRAYAALKNMKESSGNALDMAQVLRERPDLAGKSLPMSDAKIRDAVALSKLSPKAFDLVVSGVIKPEHAAPVGSAIGDSARHADMLTEMAKAGMRSAEHARLYVQQALAAPSLTETTGSLFGEETTTRSLLAERAKVLDRALGQLKSDKRIFALLEREAANIESVGNRLAHGANMEQADTAGRLAELVERLSTTRGPVSEMLDKAAIAMAEGKSPAQAARGFVGDVGKTMKSGGINALTGDAPAPVQAPVDPNQGSMFGEPGKPAGWSDEARAASAEVRKGKAKGKQSKARGRKQMMIEDGSPKPPKDIRPEFSKGQFMLADAGRSIDFSQGWKAAKAGRALPPVAQQPMDDGMFGSGMNQTDLVEMAKKLPEPPQVDRKPWKVMDSDTGKPVYAFETSKEARTWASVHNADEADGTGRKSRYRIERAVPESKQAAAVAKVQSELKEMFSRSPDGKQNRTDGTPLPDHHTAALTQTENTGYKPLSNAEIIEQAKGIKVPSAERAQQLTRRVNAISDAQFARASRGDEAGYDKAKRIYDKAQDAQLKAVAARRMAEGRQTGHEPEITARMEGKPSGWSDEARDASAQVRKENAMSKPRKPVIEKGMLVDKKAQADISKRSRALGRKLGDNPTSAHQEMGTIKLKDGTTRRVWQAHAVDAIVLDPAGNTVVIERGGHGPGKGMKATPGGFMDPSKGGGVESAKAAVLRELAEEAGVKGKVLEGADVSPVGKRKYGRSFDIREAANDIPGTPIKKGDLFTVSTQGFKIATKGEIAAGAVKAGDDARRAGVVPLRDLKPAEFGIQDHYPMIQAAAKGRPMMVTGADFDFSKAPQYRKTATLRADQVQTARGGEVVVTRQPDGKGGSFVETRNTAKAGDRIVTRSPGDSYIIGGEKFGKLYEPDPNRPGVLRSANSGRAIRVKQDVQIKAPWGEIQTIKKGGVIFKSDIDGGVYGNQKATFDADFAKAPKAPKAKSTAVDPFAVKLVPTAQREGPQGLAKALSGLSGQQALDAYKAQTGVTLKMPKGATDADMRARVAESTFKTMAERRAAAGGDPSGYTRMAEEAANHLRGTQNPENLKAIVAGKKARAKGPEIPGVPKAKRPVDNMERSRKARVQRTKDAIAGLKQQSGSAASSAQEANAALAARKEKLRGKSKVSGEDVIKALGDGRKGKGSGKPRLNNATVKALIKEGVVTKVDVKSAKSMADLTSLAERARASRNAGGNAKPAALSPELEAMKQSVQKPARKQSFVDDGTARPALPATKAKPSIAARAGHAFNVAGTAGLAVGVGAAAVMAANESAAKGESVGKQVAAGATAAGVAAAPAVVVGGAMTAAAKWGGATVAKAVPVVGWGIAGAAAVHGAVTAGREAAKEGKGAGGVAKAAAWGAVNSVVPIDAAMQAARGVRARMSSGPQRLNAQQAGQYAQANDSFQRQQAMNTTQTDTPLERKPGWSPEARVAAAKARGAVNLPYGGNPASAPNYTTPKAG